MTLLSSDSPCSSELVGRGQLDVLGFHDLGFGDRLGGAGGLHLIEGGGVSDRLVNVIASGARCGGTGGIGVGLVGDKVAGLLLGVVV